MHKRHFYANLVEIESLTVELDQLDFDEEEKIHLSRLIDSSVHHVVLDSILTHLSDEDKYVLIRKCSGVEVTN